jgi:hypothetical protein
MIPRFYLLLIQNWKSCWGMTQLMLDYEQIFIFKTEYFGFLAKLMISHTV